MMADVDDAVARIESLLDEFGEQAEAREKAEELVRALVEVYGSGLRRTLELIQESGAEAVPILDRLAEDKLVASLLLIHGLHPLDAETRIRRVVERVHRVQFLGISDGVARLSVEGGGTPAFGESIRRAVEEAAPEVEAVEIEGIVEPPAQLFQIALGARDKE